MLSQAEIAYALGYALTDGGPDKEIFSDLSAEKLGDSKVIKAHVARIYESAITSNQKRKVKQKEYCGFQEYFGYQGATDIFKDGSRHPSRNPRPE